MRQIKSYVIRSGRISNLQRDAYQRLYPAYCIDFQKQTLEIEQLFPGYSSVVVEIGFGMGLATAQIAENNPDTLFLCTEVFTAGVGKLLGEIERRQLQNVAIIQHDAVDIFTYMIPDNSLSGVHLFFPDP